MSATWKNSAVATGLKKVNFHSSAKECPNYHIIVLISHSSKDMCKILQAKFQQYVNWELPDAQDGFQRGRGSRDQIVTLCSIMEKARRFQKIIYFCFIDYAEAFCGKFLTHCGKFLKEMRMPDHLSCHLRNLYMWVKKQQLELDKEWPVQNWEKSTSRLYIITLLI